MSALNNLACSIREGRWLTEPASDRWCGASIDTRTIQPGQVFFALRGERVDGHEYVDAALAGGAAAAVIDDPGRAPTDRAGVLVVPDVTSAMAQAAAWYRSEVLAGAHVLAVTGSNGKTSTCRMLAAACSRPGQLAWLPRASFNNHLGVPLTLLNAPEDVTHVVCEIGTSGPGEIAALGEIVQPDAAAIIAVGHAHLERLGGLEGVALEKASLAGCVKPGGLVVFCADSPHLPERVLEHTQPTAGERRRAISYGFGSGADVLVEVLRETDSGVACRVGDSPEIRAPMPGRHSALNAAAAYLLAAHAGIEPARAAEGIASAEPPPMRLSWQPVGGVRVLMDAYNANPESTIAALGILAQSHATRRVAVLGDMLEMGAHARRVHAEVLDRALADPTLDRVHCVGEHFSRAAAGRERCEVHPNASVDWASGVAASLGPGDAVLVKGSRGMALERLLDRLREGSASAGKPVEDRA